MWHAIISLVFLFGFETAAFSKANVERLKHSDIIQIKKAFQEPPKDYNIIEDQSFKVSFENPALNDVAVVLWEEVGPGPLSSRFYLVKSGKRIFSFPEILGENSKNREIEAVLSVSFTDLDADGFSDVLIESKIRSSSAPSEHSVYFTVFLNDGKSGFKKDNAAENTLTSKNLKSLKEARAFLVKSYYPASK